MEIITDSRHGGFDGLLEIVEGLRQRHGGGVIASSTPAEVRPRVVLFADGAPEGAIVQAAVAVAVAAVLLLLFGVVEVLAPSFWLVMTLLIDRIVRIVGSVFLVTARVV